MKRLKLKIFAVIFILLTIFTCVIIYSSMRKNYKDKERDVTEVLKSFNGPNNKGFNPDIRRIYLDFDIYTIVLDDNGNYESIIDNTNNEVFDENNIKLAASSIINNHKDKMYVGNLYVDNYSYVFINDHTLILMDNSEINGELVSRLIVNIYLLIIIEVIIFVFTIFITEWIIVPVKKSIERQKTFIADASHELKTPLAVMVASADAYFNDKDDKWVHNMKNESIRMTKLVTGLLDLARTEKEQEVEMKRNNLSTIVEGSILTFESLLYEKDIKLDYNIEPNIMTLCNEDLIIQLMTILIDNAIKHCSSRKKIIVNLSKKHRQIIIEVKNTGAPIKEADRTRIFERFYKADESRNRNSNNYGLGLAIAKNIVEKHDGFISASSFKGYTTFKVIMNQKII